MAHIIGVVQLKGGVGRSTLATNLAGIFSSQHQTALIDCDVPQGTCAAWFAIRQAAGRARNLSLGTAADHIRLVWEVDRLNRTHDVIVIDGNSRSVKTTVAILKLSQICLVPLSGSAAEIWRTGALLKAIAEAKERKPEVDARIVWTRFRSVTKSAQEQFEAVTGKLKLKQLNARLGYRVAYSDALAHGRTVMGWSDAAAKEEMGALALQIWGILKRKHIEARKWKEQQSRNQS